MFDVDRQDYPQRESLLSPPDEFNWDYIANSYLDGIINYTKVLHIFAHHIYEKKMNTVLQNLVTNDDGSQEFIDNDHEEKPWGDIGVGEHCTEEEVQAALKEKFSKHHSTFGGCGEFNYSLICESQHHWWHFYYDQDCSDCGLVKIRKSRMSLNKFIEQVHNNSREKYYEFPTNLLKGWIGF